MSNQQQAEIVLFEVKSEKSNAPKYSGFIKYGNAKVPMVAFQFTSRDGKYTGLRVVQSKSNKEAA